MFRSCAFRSCALKATAKILTIVSATFLVACGFQLRGDLNLPPEAEPISILTNNPYSSFSIALRNSLSSRQVKLADIIEPSIEEMADPELAAAPPKTIATQGFQIKILGQRGERRVLTLGTGATVAEYQLIEEVTFDLRNPQGKVVMGPVTLSERQVLPNDPNKVVSTGQESSLIRQEMHSTLAQKVARQISRFDFDKAINKPAKPKQPASATP